MNRVNTGKDYSNTDKIRVNEGKNESGKGIGVYIIRLTRIFLPE
ncbi:MAG TPA: hypothetical protein VIK89_13925 [Cytophagaceae bacterium]